MKPSKLFQRYKFLGLLFDSANLLAGVPPASYLKSGIFAYQGRRWIEAMDCFLRVLAEDPQNPEAHAYWAKIAQQIDEERVALVNDARMDMLARTAQRLDVAHLDAQPVDRAIDESKSKEAGAQEEERHFTCILARKEESLGH